MRPIIQIIHNHGATPAQLEKIMSALDVITAGVTKVSADVAALGTAVTSLVANSPTQAEVASAAAGLASLSTAVEVMTAQVVAVVTPPAPTA